LHEKYFYHDFTLIPKYTESVCLQKIYLMQTINGQIIVSEKSQLRIIEIRIMKCNKEHC